MSRSRRPETAGAAIASPCIGLCRLDRDQVCTGCGRSIAEIAHWRHMTEAERSAVMGRLRCAATSA